MFIKVNSKKYLQKFLDFKDEDEKKFAKDYEGELANARGMLKYIKKQNSLKLFNSIYSKLYKRNNNHKINKPKMQ